MREKYKTKYSKFACEDIIYKYDGENKMYLKADFAVSRTFRISNLPPQPTEASADTQARTYTYEPIYVVIKKCYPRNRSWRPIGL
jgi:hypothetical protein